MYEIPGLKSEYRNISKIIKVVEYKGLFVTFSIAKDSMGTQICFNGRFFGPMDFKGIDDAYEYLKNNYKEAIKFYKKEWFKHKLWSIKYSLKRIFHIKSKPKLEPKELLDFVMRMAMNIERKDE